MVLECCDTFEFMASLPDNHFEVICADLPYGTTKCKWDSVLDLVRIWENYNRILKPNGVVLLFAQTPFDKVLGVSNLSNLRYEWIWEKTQATGFLNAKKMPLKAHENILVFYRNLPYFNPIMSTGHKPINSYTIRASVQNKTEVYGKVSKDISGGGETTRFPRSVLKYASEKQRFKSLGILHPTQKPLALLEFFMQSYTLPGFNVLDNTMGSGTCAVAADKYKCNFWGCDNSQKYVDIAKRRVHELKF